MSFEIFPLNNFKEIIIHENKRTDNEFFLEYQANTAKKREFGNNDFSILFHQHFFYVWKHTFKN